MTFLSIVQKSQTKLKIPESFNAKISHQLFDTLTFVHNTRTQIQKVFCAQKQVLNVRVKEFLYTKINPTQI